MPSHQPIDILRNRMDKPHIQRTTGLSSNTAHSTSAAMPLKVHSSEQEAPRWPLRTVDDNAAASRCQSASQTRPKASYETEHFGNHTVDHRSLPVTYHPSACPRRGLDDLAFSRDSTARSFEEDHLARERRIRSYRDTTSEIISLYASRNGTTQNSELTRNEDGDSSTASHSRYPVRQRYMHTNGSHLRSGSWQKSRTPGPYPTRLRRPGTGITSPVMAELQGKEYSRMAEADRGHYVCFTSITKWLKLLKTIDKYPQSLQNLSC